MLLLDVPDKVVIDRKLPIAAIEGARPDGTAAVSPGVFLQVAQLVEASWAELAAVGEGMLLFVFPTTCQCIIVGEEKAQLL